MSVLITGGNGFVGLNLAEELLSRGETVVSVSRRDLPEGAKKALGRHPGRLTSVLCDIRDVDSLAGVMNANQVDRVFHGATVTAGADREAQFPGEIVDINIMGTLSVIEALRRSGVRRIVYASSGAVYGGTRYEKAVDETSAVSPGGLYAITKYSSEMICSRISEIRDLDVVIARISAVFGPWERDTGVRDTLSPFLLLSKLALEKKQVSIAFGHPLDWIYSRDVAVACAELLYRTGLKHQVYNVVPGTSWHLRLWADWLKQEFPGFAYRTAHTHRDADVSEYNPSGRERHPMKNGRIREVLPLFPLYERERAFEDYTKWIIEHADFIRQIDSQWSSGEARQPQTAVMTENPRRPK